MIVRLSRMLVAVALVWAPVTLFAQETIPVAELPAASQRILLTAGRSTVLTAPFQIERLAVTNPAVADATVVEATEVLIDGKSSGTVSLILWGAGQRVHYDIVVDAGVTSLQQHLQALFPGEDIVVSQSEAATILSGHVSSNVIMLRAAEIATASAPKTQVINMLQLPGGQESNQVMLQVRIAEVNSRAFQEFGINLFTGGTGVGDTVMRGTTQQFTAPTFAGLTRTEENGEVIETEGDLTFSDFLNLFVFSNDLNIGAVIRALRQRGWLQSLAEPNLIAYNGQQASFLAGGEFPVPVVQGASGAVSIQFREFGVRLAFTPTIAGDVIRLKVRPEVSSLDFANGLTLAGFRVPALTSRWAQTDVELRDGQSFAIAGLLSNIAQEDTAAIPILSSLPIIGHLFRSKSERAERTELMVLITPRLVRALDPDEVPPMPTMPRRFLPPDDAIGEGLDGGGGLVDAPAPGVQP